MVGLWKNGQLPDDNEYKGQQSGVCTDRPEYRLIIEVVHGADAPIVEYQKQF
jgi:hypothetical protein